MVSEARAKLKQDAAHVATTTASSREDSRDHSGLESGGTGFKAYAEAVSIYLGFGVSKLADYCGTLVQWSVSRDQAVHVFGRQALPMVWDFCEVNVFAGGAGDYGTSLSGIVRTVEVLSSQMHGEASQADASTQRISTDRFVSTDPPYYDNIGYADLSDFFYVWLTSVAYGRCSRT